MILQNDDDSLILFCAFRYALGRRTYVVGCVTECLQKHWHELSKGDRSLIIREIGDAIERGQAGDYCDVLQWKALMERELEIK